jgi:uncharacterized protein (DUF58 family)
MVKEVEDPADRTLYLVFDATRVWGEGRETTLEYGIKIIASAVVYAHRNQIPVKLLGGGIGDKGPAPSGPETHDSWRGWPPLLKNLALVNQGDGPELADMLAKIPPGGTAMAVVALADRRAVGALARASTMLRQLAVVTLEGFEEPEAKEAGLRSLQAAGIPVVRCWRGQIEDALRSLEVLKGPSPRQSTFREFDASNSKAFDSATRNGTGRKDLNGGVPGAQGPLGQDSSL